MNVTNEFYAVNVQCPCNLAMIPNKRAYLLLGNILYHKNNLSCFFFLKHL